MAHITFIHGIGNKPQSEELHRIWRRTLAKSGLDLGELGVTSSMVYWADVLYAAPDPDVASYENLLEAGEMAAAVGDSAFEAPSMEETAFVAGISAKVGSAMLVALPDADARRADAGDHFERIPLPWPIKEAFLKRFLKDTHHYLFDTEFSPRPGVSYRVQEEIRKRFADALGAVDKDEGPHIVISHSMGTVIAYDCLKRVAECPEVDALVTIGSPLGLDEVQDKLTPGWSEDDGFPAAKVASRRWLNVYDRLDPVCGFDPILTNDFCEGGQSKVEDLAVSNDGSWRHSIVKYLAQQGLRQKLVEFLTAGGVA